VSARAQEGGEEVNTLPNIVLVQGAWADGYTVTAPQFPLTALADDVARLRQVLARQNGPTIVAGHSYGGQIITALGTDAPNVVALVYIAAFGLDAGESISTLLAPEPVLAHLFIDQQGFAWLPEDDFMHHFAADVEPVKARVMYAVQQPLSAAALDDMMGVPAWKALPSWFMVAERDQAIWPNTVRQFAKRMGATTVEVPANHLAMVSHPQDVVQLISAPDRLARTNMGFEQDIKPLFRPKDRDSMSFAFDLWSYQEVSANADAILQRLVGRTMPCDGAWPHAQVELFRRWIEAGKQP
jgi:pimeloyl-ACP methyl ester carboxylesterase